MPKIIPVSLLAVVAATLAACQVAPTRALSQPSAEEMRDALKTMLDAHPEMSIPEFADSLKYDHPVYRDTMVYIGAWNCNPSARSFDAVFTASNVTFFEVSGRFDQDTRGRWQAIPHNLQTVNGQDIGDYWRASDVDKIQY
jgi:hypothetical protein